MVTINKLVLTYELRVDGREAVRCDYQRSFTRAFDFGQETHWAPSR